ERRVRQAVFLEVRPLASAIVGNIYAAARAAAEFTIRMHFCLPHPCEQGVGIMLIHRQAGTANILAREKDTFPMLATIRSSKDSAVLLRSGHATHDAGKNYVGI